MHTTDTIPLRSTAPAGVARFSARGWQCALAAVPVALLWWFSLANANPSARTWITLAGLLAIALTVGVFWFFTRDSQSLGQPIAAAEAIIKGNLTAKFAVPESGDMRDLMVAMNTLNERMFNLIHEVRGKSTNVVSTSSQVSRDTETLRIRTEMQIKSLQETMEAMQQLNDIVQRNAQQAAEADQIVASASTHAVEGGQAMGQVVATMGTIRDSSKKIVDIIGLIDSIAFQTNILALNAAVEAARAGDHGRGFAVVAAEVGTLAKRSATAAKEIKSLINSSVKTIANGSELVENAGAKITQIVGSVKSLTGLIQDISHSSRDQRGGIDSVNAKVTEVMRLNKSNAKMFGDMIKASNVLNEQSVTLLKSLAGFDLGIREAGTPEEAQAMVRRAVEFLNTQGRDALIADVNKLEAGRFIERDLYVYVIDINTYKYHAHGINPRVINYDSRLSKDPNGRSYMTEAVDLARAQGEGWIEYLNNHPITNELKTKVAFVQRVGDLVIGCGAYKD